METAGYSGTHLAKKLGIKSGFNILLINQPTHYPQLFSDFPEDVAIATNPSKETLDFIHLFCITRAELEPIIPSLKSFLKKNGMLWVSWPKGSSKIPTDLKRDFIREHILAQGLVDVKVAAIDENWSGLKFVYRLVDRK